MHGRGHRDAAEIECEVCDGHSVICMPIAEITFTSSPNGESSTEGNRLAIWGKYNNEKTPNNHMAVAAASWLSVWLFHVNTKPRPSIAA